MRRDERQQLQRAHDILGCLGVPEMGPDGTPLSLEARLARYARKHEMLNRPVDIPAEQWCDGRAFAVPNVLGVC